MDSGGFGVGAGVGKGFERLLNGLTHFFLHVLELLICKLDLVVGLLDQLVDFIDLSFQLELAVFYSDVYCLISFVNF